MPVARLSNVFGKSRDRLLRYSRLVQGALPHVNVDWQCALAAYPKRSLAISALTVAVLEIHGLHGGHAGEHFFVLVFVLS